MKYAVAVAGRDFMVDLRGNTVHVNGEPVEVRLTRVPGTPLHHLTLGSDAFLLAIRRRTGGWSVVSAGEILNAEVVDERTRQLRRETVVEGRDSGRLIVKAPMPGLVLRLEVEPGAVVKKGQGLLVLEAMKMENELKAPGGGTVSAIHVKAGQPVEKGMPLVEVSP